MNVRRMAQRESLDEALKRVRQVLKSSAAGPLIAGIEMMRIADRWSEYSEAQTKGLSCTAAARQYTGFYLGYFAIRKRAVDIVGKDCVRWATDELAMRLARIKDDAMRREAVAAVLDRFADRRKHHFITEKQAEGVIAEVVGKPGRREKAVWGKCPRCARYRALLARHGIKDETGDEDVIECEGYAIEE